MTRERIVDGLLLLAMGLGHSGPLNDPPDGWTPHEWAYVKGVASGAILRVRDLLMSTP